MTDLERYLKLATWGLPRRQRDDVRSELEEHVLERAAGLQAFGVPEDEAVKRALAELGPPERVCTGMNGVYLMPKIMKLTALSTIVVTLSLAGMTSGGAQVTTTDRRPQTPTCAQSSKPLTSDERITVVRTEGTLTCYVFKDSGSYQGVYLSLDSLEQVLRSQGVQVRKQGATTSFKFPNARREATPRVSFSQNGDRFISLAQTALNFGNLGLPVRLSGWTNPTVSIGSVDFKIGTAQQPVEAVDVYREILIDVLLQLTPTTSFSLARQGPGNPGGTAHTLQVNLPEGSVVGILTRRASGPAADFARVGKNGTVTLYPGAERLSFVTDPKQLTPYLSNGSARAVLVRLLGNLNAEAGKQYEIIAPSLIQSDAAAPR